MSLTLGNGDVQEMMPLGNGGESLDLDPRMKIGPQRPISRSRSRSAEHRETRGRKRRRSRSPPPRRHARPEKKKHRGHRAHDDENDKRLYRPTSPTESVQSDDFAIIADKNKIVDESKSKRPKTDSRGATFDEFHKRMSPEREMEREDDGEFYSDESDEGEFDDDRMSYGSGSDVSDFSDVERGSRGRGAFDNQNKAGESGMGFENQPTSSAPSTSAPRLTYDEQLRKKAELLERLQRKKQRNLLKLDFDENMTLEQLMVADARSQYRSSSDTAVAFMRRGLMLYMVVLEALAKRFQQMNIDLEGFSQYAYSNGNNEYDDLLYEIYDMYHDRVKINPVWQLMGMVTTQALMYSMARKVMSQSQGFKYTAPSAFNSTPIPTQSAAASQPAAPNRSTTSPSSVSPAAMAGGNASVGNEIGVMDGPSDFDSRQLLDMLRQEQQQKIDQQQQQQQHTAPAHGASAEDDAKTIEMPALSSQGSSGRVKIIKQQQKAARPVGRKRNNTVANADLSSELPAVDMSAYNDDGLGLAFENDEKSF